VQQRPVAQGLVALYQLTEPAQARARARVRARATKAVPILRDYPIPEIAKLGRKLHGWRGVLFAHFDHPDVSKGPTKNLNVKIRTPDESPAAAATSPTTGYDSCSTTAASTKITYRHGSEPVVQVRCVAPPFPCPNFEL
jgi:hypothetical protein